MFNLQTGTYRKTDLGEHSADASDIGLPPGAWPTILEMTVAPGRVIVFRSPVVQRDGEGDITKVTYHATGYGRFVIWND